MSFAVQQGLPLLLRQQAAPSTIVQAVLEQSCEAPPVQHLEAESRLQQVFLYSQAALEEHSL
jgi:hypothetical protein